MGAELSTGHRCLSTGWGAWRPHSPPRLETRGPGRALWAGTPPGQRLRGGDPLASKAGRVSEGQGRQGDVDALRVAGPCGLSPHVALGTLSRPLRRGDPGVGGSCVAMRSSGGRQRGRRTPCCWRRGRRRGRGPRGLPVSVLRGLGGSTAAVPAAHPALLGPHPQLSPRRRKGAELRAQVQPPALQPWVRGPHPGRGGPFCLGKTVPREGACADWTLTGVKAPPARGHPNKYAVSCGAGRGLGGAPTGPALALLPGPREAAARRQGPGAGPAAVGPTKAGGAGPPPAPTQKEKTPDYLLLFLSRCIFK